MCVKFVVEFFKFQSTETIAAGLLREFEDPKFKFKSPDDPLKIYVLWIHMNRLMERSSPLVNNPIYLFMMMKAWLEKKGPKGAGKAMVRLIEKALGKLNSDPESVLPPNHMLSNRQLAEIKRRGQAEAESETYRLIQEEGES